MITNKYKIIFYILIFTIIYCTCIIEPFINNKKILVCVLSYHKNYNLCKTIYNTWGKHVNILFFVDKHTNEFPNVVLKSNDPANLWQKVSELWLYIYNNLYYKYDFFFQVDDDTFVNYINLQKYVNTLPTNKPIYAGKRFYILDQQLYFNSGGAGYILNKKSIEILINKMKKIKYNGPGDTGIGVMFKNTIKVYNTTDKYNRDRFHPFNPITMADVNQNNKFWYHDYIAPFNTQLGVNNISNETISYHYIDESMCEELYKNIDL